jgi:rhodanese-related sulfurtransferase
VSVSTLSPDDRKAVLAWSPGHCARRLPPLRSRIVSVQVDEFSKRRADFHLLDVREDDEWTAGHIDGAQHIPLGELSARLGELPKEKTIVAVCRSGGRSEAAVRGLRRLGYEAENLEGGVNAWDRAKLPLVDNAGGRGRVI